MRLRPSFILSLAAAVFLAACGQQPDERDSFNVVEATIPEMQAAMQEGRLTSRELVEIYLQRIATYENVLNPSIAVNPRALAEADRLDAERAAGQLRGPLHGIPIALKDNIHTTDMPTTGGALALEGLMVPYDATITANLRHAGAVIIAKTVLTELANWVAADPYDMPDNYSSLGGYGFNPYDPRRDPREGFNDGQPVLSPGGSSSGIGTAANLWAASVGTETSGSILWPSSQTMLAAVKPTVGRISRYGIIPITADQDTAGPMARTVADAAILLGAMESAAPDDHDPASGRCAPPPDNDYTAFLDAGALKGARIGIPRAGFYDAVAVPGRAQPRPGLNAAQAAVMDEALAVLRDQGAVLVDPANIPSVLDPDIAENVFAWGVCSGENDEKGEDDDCSTVFKYGMKRDFNAWLDTLGAAAPFDSLLAMTAWNDSHRSMGTLKYEQGNLLNSAAMDLEADRGRYEADRDKDLELAATQGIDAAFSEHQLDALLFPSSRGAGVAAKPGYPSVAVPFGMVPNDPDPPFPEGFDARPVPFGVTFTGRACSEPRLLAITYAFEQATKRRIPPPGLP